MKPDLYNFISTVAADHGVDAAAELAAFEAKHLYAIKEFTQKEKIDCDYTVTKAVDVQLSRDHFKTLKEGHERLVACGCTPTKQVHCVGPDEAQAVSLG